MTYAQSWLELEKSMGGRMVLKGSAEEIRAQTEQLIQILLPQLPPPSDAVESKDGEVDGIKYRLYTPKEASKQGPLPVGIWTHGGGWATGDLNSDDLLIRIVAEHAQSIVVNVDYRLAPEHKAPTQLEDTLTVYNWARQNATSFGGDLSKFYSIGGSAGGALALQLANRIVKDPSKRDGIKGVAAIVPVTLHYDHVPEEYKSMFKAMQENEKDVPIIDKESMRSFYEFAGVDPQDSDIFTALATDNHKNFPPVYFVSCEKDPLRDDAYVMEAALKKAGVPTKHDTYPGLPHYFFIFPSLPESQQFVGNLIGGVKWLTTQM
ncbi:Telomerase-binding protein [Exophiala xenobiotica]|uniref:Telomerase-binding protein n=1 Tax=Vermiconidia calcicola TaxID=1690605 RepID=A0AAV9Q573_9PEZI|nr:Telomerase-binding protein [Exophiala xenobiotica]KAK5533309.1 Telomerase-binding protein [Vermiconidia calcicola]KAK5534262.1 Telomerase-binding protein [Chaetothyriales sp. CCFEE 6169]KAK5205765.1 Telomerase-binding protein [Exophiala xenobiotica]KAK5216971.1 Telomerase-binding protein [Exophiala xenobiotica]